MRFTSIGTAAVAWMLIIAGCGGGGGQDGEESAIRAQMAELQRLSRAGDASGICADLFTAQLTASIERSSDRSCVRAVRDELATPRETINVKSVEISGPTNATATITEQTGKTSTLYLVKQDGKWRIRSISPSLASRR